MADAGPNYSVERRRLLVQKLEHEQTITKSENRLVEIEQQKQLNLQRAELLNLEMDDEVERINTNINSLHKAIAEIGKKIDLMKKEPGDG